MVTLAIGYVPEAPTVGSVLKLNDTTLTVGARHCCTSLGEASVLRRKPGVFCACRQIVFFALVSASALLVPLVAAYSAASRVADSSVIHVWKTRAKSMVSPRKASMTGSSRANSAIDWPRPRRFRRRAESGFESPWRGWWWG